MDNSKKSKEKHIDIHSSYSNNHEDIKINIDPSKEINPSSSAVILKELTKIEKNIETAYSFVMLGDKEVYKFYKPSNFGLVENKLNNNRKKHTMYEADFNNKFSNGIYDEVMKIVRKNETKFDLVPMNNSLTAIDYIVKMKRVSDDSKLSNLIFNMTLTSDNAKLIGAEFFKILDNQRHINCDPNEYYKYLKVLINDLLKYAEESISSINRHMMEGKDKLSDSNFNSIKESLLKDIDVLESEIKERAEKNLVIEGHGNARLKHVLFNSPHSCTINNEELKIGLMDTFVFSNRIRNLDILFDFATILIDFNIINNNHKISSFLINNNHNEYSDEHLKNVISKDYKLHFVNGFNSEYESKYEKINDSILEFYENLAKLVRINELLSYIKDANQEWSFYNDLLNVNF